MAAGGNGAGWLAALRRNRVVLCKAAITIQLYTNQSAGTVATTTLYDLDLATGVLTTQNPPNNGTLNTIGALGVRG